MTPKKLLSRRGPFRIQPASRGAPAPLSQLPSVWWDWAFYDWPEGGGIRQSITGSSGPQSSVELLVDGQPATLRQNQIRLYIEPTFDRPLDAGNDDLPAAAQAWLAKRNRPVGPDYRLIEYALLRGKSYHAEVHIDTYALPPRPGGSRPRNGKNPILRISDKPFEELPPNTDPIPPFRGFCY